MPRPVSLYVHVPFCVRKCHYCDFISYPGKTWPEMQTYCRDIKKEAELLVAKYQPRVLATVYFGGGTPTLLPPEELAKLLKIFDNYFHYTPHAEISLEANPGTIDATKLRLLKAAGFNRLSLGVQSFDDNLLEYMGRIHRRKEVYESYYLARQEGFQNINLDLIFGLPGQTVNRWERTLEEAINLQPEHIAAYSLQVEPGTPWGNLAQAGKLSLPDEEKVLEMYRITRQKLAVAGYEHYEISNFARKGYRCRHNLNYWYNNSYLGLGVSAASYWQEIRWRNCDSIEEYGAILAAGELPCTEREILSSKLQMAETMFMGLRLIEGININNFKERFSVDPREIYASEIMSLLEVGLIEIENDYIRLTEKGLPVANEVFVNFI